MGRTTSIGPWPRLALSTGASSMPLNPGSDVRLPPGLPGLRFRDIMCLVVLVAFAAGVVGGLVVSDGTSLSDRVCENESSSEELESDEDGFAFDVGCLGDSLMQAPVQPSRLLVDAPTVRAESLWFGPSLARGPPV